MEDMAIISLQNWDAALEAAKGKSGNSAPMTSGELAQRILDIPVGKPEQEYSKTYTSNGKYIIVPDEGKTISGGEIIVDVPTSGGGCNLTSLIATPTKQQQSFTPDAGYDGFNAVTVEKIPDEYKDTSGVTTSSKNVLDGFQYFDSEGIKTGSMPNNGDVSGALDATTASVTIPEGYTSGGTISVALEQKKATPTKSKQDISATPGKLISEFTVEPIPDKYQDVSNVTATPDKVFDGFVYVDGTGEKTGTYKPKEEQEKTVSINDNGDVIVTPDTGKTMNKVIAKVNVPKRKPEESKSVTYDTNGNFSLNPSAGAVFSSVEVTVDVKPKLEALTATPSKKKQTFNPDTGIDGYSVVTVNPIPARYKDAAGVKTTADEVLSGSLFINESGKQTGTMANNGAANGTIDGLNTTSFTIPDGYTTGGTVTFDETAILAKLTTSEKALLDTVVTLEAI